MFLFENSYLLKGFLVGFSVAAPIGPVAIFCMRQTLTFGRLAGLSAGLGVSLADGVYSAVALYGASFIDRFIHLYAKWFFLVGSLFLFGIGFSILRNQAHAGAQSHDMPARNLWLSFWKTLLLTFASPTTTILFIGMFTAYGVFEKSSHSLSPTDLVLGVFFGAMTWWACLTFTVKYIQEKIGHNMFKYINLVSGSLIVIYGGLTFTKFFTSFF